jgi:hypothetical protein
MRERHRLDLARPGDDWDAVSLSFARTVSELAAGEGRAVQWGNDVVAQVWIETFGIRSA